MLTAVDLTSREFKKNLRGYNVDEVDALIEEAALNIGELTNENRLLKEKLKAMEDRTQGYLTMESSLKEALVVAQKVSNETKEAAFKEAEVIRREAEATALKIIRDAKEEVYQAEQRAQMLKQTHDEFKLELEHHYTSELAKLKNR